MWASVTVGRGYREPRPLAGQEPNIHHLATAYAQGSHTVGFERVMKGHVRVGPYITSGQLSICHDTNWHVRSLGQYVLSTNRLRNPILVYFIHC